MSVRREFCIQPVSDIPTTKEMDKQDKTRAMEKKGRRFHPTASCANTAVTNGSVADPHCDALSFPTALGTFLYWQRAAKDHAIATSFHGGSCANTAGTNGPANDPYWDALPSRERSGLSGTGTEQRKTTAIMASLHKYLAPASVVIWVKESRLPLPSSQRWDSHFPSASTTPHLREHDYSVSAPTKITRFKRREKRCSIGSR